MNACCRNYLIGKFNKQCKWKITPTDNIPWIFTGINNILFQFWQFFSGNNLTNNWVKDCVKLTGKRFHRKWLPFVSTGKSLILKVECLRHFQIILPHHWGFLQRNNRPFPSAVQSNLIRIHNTELSIQDVVSKYCKLISLICCTLKKSTDIDSTNNLIALLKHSFSKILHN